MIEQVVRVQLLLLGVLLSAAAALLVHRGGPAAWAGVVPVVLCLVGAGRLLAKVGGREVLKLAQRGLLAVVVLFFVGVALGPRLGFYRTLTVLSGSMRPTFNPGDVIVVTPEALRDVRVGQVISYNVPDGAHQLETHRVIKVLQGGAEPVVQTQGDANNWRDPWTAKLHGDKAWRLAFVIPYAGFAINFLRDPTVHRAAIFVAPGLVALLVLAEIWGVSLPRRRPGVARP
jgi:signal peptidase